MRPISSFLQHFRNKWTQSWTKHTQKKNVKRRSLFSWSNWRRLGRAEGGNAVPEETPVLPKLSFGVMEETSTIPGRPYNLMADGPELPSLPALPIYQSFTSTGHLGTFGPNKTNDESSKQHRLRRVAGVADFKALKLESRSVQDSAAPIQGEVADKAPAYDRAVELAAAYQSILPEFQAMFEGDDESTTERGKGKQRSTQSRQNTIDSGITLLPSIEEEVDEWETSAPRTPLFPSFDQAQSAGSSVTSLTTASEISEYVDNTIYHALATGTGLRPRTCSSPRPPDALSPPAPSAEAHTRTGAPVSTIATRPRAISEPQAQRRHRYLLSQHGSIVLQAQDRGSGPNKGNGKEMEKPENGFKSNLTQMQVLLLIEAYRGVLKSCRRRTLLPTAQPVVAAQGSSNSSGPSRDTASIAREAVPILEHWLTTLNVMYEWLLEEEK
ncbi:hypothetical protein B0I37DRAFT_425351 [Chaetomium sp. MPI-CAGE-AT-0009]|nr:hypothetical protein B0I37DRAFT_425351 [Chaetomium sp. MPI-CAGE-AT-0009]